MVPQFNQTEIDNVRARITPQTRIAITTHHKPDGDAVGSSIALHNILRTLTDHVTVIFPSDFPDFLQWMIQCTVLNADEQLAQCNEAFAAADIIFVLDFNDARRVEKLTPALLHNRAFKVMIDHHLQPEAFCHVTFSFPTAGSTAELIYHFATALLPQYTFDKHTASCLYAGVMTDTGSFRFASTTGDTHRMIAGLLDCGVVPNTIHENIFDNYSEQRTRFLGHCLSDKLVVLPQYNTAYIYVDKNELKQYNHQTGDTEGIVNYALGVRGIKMAAFFCEHDDIIKISFRSKGKFSVRDLASQHFYGGGHQNAAGGKSNSSLQLTIEKFLSILPQYATLLQHE